MGDKKKKSWRRPNERSVEGMDGRRTSLPGRNYLSSAERQMCKARRRAIDGDRAKVTYVGKEAKEVIGGRRVRAASVGCISLMRNPAKELGKAISEALDPTRAPSKVRTLGDMSEEEIAALEARLGCKVARRA